MNSCDDAGYDLEFDFSDYADPGSPIWTPELDGIRDYIDTLAREIVLKQRVAELSRGERSIFPAIPPRKNGKQTPCHFRRHMKGAILEVYGYGLNLAEKDPEGFFWSGFENLQKKSSKRVRVRGKGERKTRKKPYHTRARTETPYSERQIHRAVEALVKEGLFTPAVRIRLGTEQHGWIVKPHDKFSTLVTYGGHQYCVPEPFGTVARLYEQVRIGRLDISGLVSAIWDLLDKEIEKKIDQKLAAKSAQTLHACCKDAANSPTSPEIQGDLDTQRRTQRTVKAYTKDSPLRTQRTVTPPPKSLEPQELRDSGKILGVGSLGQPLQNQDVLAHARNKPTPTAQADLHAGSGKPNPEQTVPPSPTNTPPQNFQKISPSAQTIKELFPINPKLEEPITGFLFNHPHTNHYTQNGYEDLGAFQLACLNTVNTHAEEIFLGIKTCVQLTKEVMDRSRVKKVKAPKGWYPILKTLRGFSKQNREQDFMIYFLDKLGKIAREDRGPAIECEFDLLNLFDKHLQGEAVKKFRIP